MRHGTNTAYINGCRCDACRRAATEAKRVQVARRKLHGPLTVPADEAVAHIKFLRKHGHPNRAIARLAGVNKSTITDILHGHRKVILLDTAEAILSATPYDVTPESRVPIKRTKTLVRAMQKHGVPLAQQARMLGYDAPALSFMYGRKTVFTDTARRVEVLYRLLAREGVVPAKPLLEVTK